MYSTRERSTEVVVTSGEVPSTTPSRITLISPTTCPALTGAVTPAGYKIPETPQQIANEAYDVRREGDRPLDRRQIDIVR